MNESSVPAPVITRAHISALTLMKFLLLVATVFCEDKMDYLTPESAWHNVQFSGHRKLPVDIAALLYCFLHFGSINKNYTYLS